MSETTLATSQTADAALAADERLATKEGRSQFWRATFSCWLGTAMEYVDFALYGLAAGMVFGDVFFPRPRRWSPCWPASPPTPSASSRGRSARWCSAGSAIAKAAAWC